MEQNPDKIDAYVEIAEEVFQDIMQLCGSYVIAKDRNRPDIAAMIEFAITKLSVIYDRAALKVGLPSFTQRSADMIKRNPRE